MRALGLHLSKLGAGRPEGAPVERLQHLLEPQHRPQLPLAVGEAKGALEGAQQQQRKLAKTSRARGGPTLEERGGAFVAANPGMGPRGSAKISRQARATRGVVPELPKKFARAGGPQSLLAPLPMGGAGLGWGLVADGQTTGELLLARNKRRYEQAGGGAISIAKGSQGPWPRGNARHSQRHSGNFVQRPWRAGK